MAWLFLPSWVHFEVVRTAPAYLLKPGESLFFNSLDYGFNLKITELGYYRPRFLCFLIEFLDTNLSFYFYQKFPQLGLKLPSYAASIMATVASFVWFYKTLFPKTGYGVALLGGASLLFYDVYQNTSFMVLRGGKFLTSAAGIFLVTIYLRYHRRDFSLSSLGTCLIISCVCFLLATMDEQITAVVFFTCFVALIVLFTEKKISQSFVIFVLAALNYCLYYFYWGRWLFSKFTPDGIQVNNHPHNFSDVFKVNFENIKGAAEMLLSNFIALGIPSLAFILVFFCSVANIYRKNNNITKNMLSCAAFLLFPIALTSVMVASHPAIYSYKSHQLWSLFYLLLPIHTLIISVIYSLYLANFKTNLFKAILAVCFIYICTNGVVKMDGLHHIACTNASKIFHSFNCGVNPFSLMK